MTTAEGWRKRKERYGPTGAKDPSAFSQNCSESQHGHPPYEGFKGHNIGHCRKCGVEHSSQGKFGYGNSNWGGFQKNGHNYGDCKACGQYHKPGMLGKHHSAESKQKSSASNKIAQNTPEMIEKKKQDARKQGANPITMNKRLASDREHKDAILEEMKKRLENGWEVLLVDHVRPDLILRNRKENKLVAVEVDFDGNTKREKYDGVTFFDDIQWVEKKHEHYFTTCEQCGKRFEYRIITTTPKYCSRKCYWASLKGKPIQWQNTMHPR